MDSLCYRFLAIRFDNVPNKTYCGKRSDEQVSDIKFPEFAAGTADAVLGMMIIVPAFSKAQNGNPPAIATVFVSLKGAITPFVGGAVN